LLLADGSSLQWSGIYGLCPEGSKSPREGAADLSCADDADFFYFNRRRTAKGQKCLTKSVSQGSDKRHVTISCTEHDDHGDHYCAPLGAGIDERRYILHLSIPKP
jgi:hypothetical protein